MKVVTKELIALTIAGGLVFWVATIITSLLPIAAGYRAANSNWSMQTVWVASFPMGMVISFGVSYLFLRYFDKIPTGSPILKAMIIGFCAFIIALILADLPTSIYGIKNNSDALHYFLIGAMFNVVRFLLLGAAVGSFFILI